MGCQRKIAKKIIDAGGDYVLAVKGNQEKLHTAITTPLRSLLEEDFPSNACRRHRTQAKGHGRIEERLYHLSALPESLQSFVHNWKGRTTIGHK